MSQTAPQAPLTTVWNMAAPLRVLLVENSPADAELNLHELQRAGFQCQPQTISSPEQFLRYQGRFPFDIVLADYRLPGWTGMDAFTAMRRAGHDAPFILVTGVLGEEVAVECIKHDGVVKRPTTSTTFIQGLCGRREDYKNGVCLPRGLCHRPCHRFGVGFACKP